MAGESARGDSSSAIRDTAAMKWSSILIVACLLVMGFAVGRLSSPPAPAGPSAGDSSRLQAPVPPAKRAQKQPKKGFSYDGAEYEVQGPNAKRDWIDRFTLRLRAKQPIGFLGVPMQQIPSDNWLLADLISRIKPDYVIETGTLWGGSAIYYSALLEFVNPAGKVISIDINEKQILPKARDHDLWKRRVKFIKGSSTAPEVIEQIKEELGSGKIALITLDTLHAPDHVRKELELYSQFVSKGSYMILQDTYYEGLPEVLDEFLASHEEFQRDTRLDERYIFTKYRGGFLRRE